MRYWEEFLWLLRRINSSISALRTELTNTINTQVTNLGTRITNKKNFVQNRNTTPSGTIEAESLWFKVWDTNDHSQVPS